MRKPAGTVVLGRHSLCSVTSHVRQTSLTPLGLMLICSRQICAGAVDREANPKAKAFLSEVVRNRLLKLTPCRLDIVNPCQYDNFLLIIEESC